MYILIYIHVQSQSKWCINDETMTNPYMYGLLIILKKLKIAFTRHRLVLVDGIRGALSPYE